MTGHNGGREEMRLLPLFKFTLMRPDTVPAVERYHVQRVEDFKKRVDNEFLTLSWRETNIAPDTLVMLDKQYVEEPESGGNLVDGALRARRLAGAHQAVHQCRQYLLVGHRA